MISASTAPFLAGHRGCLCRCGGNAVATHVPDVGNGGGRVLLGVDASLARLAHGLRYLLCMDYAQGLGPHGAT